MIMLFNKIAEELTFFVAVVVVRKKGVHTDDHNYSFNRNIQIELKLRLNKL